MLTEKLGLSIGQEFEVIKEHTKLKKGTVVKLTQHSPTWVVEVAFQGNRFFIHLNKLKKREKFLETNLGVSLEGIS